MRSIPRIFLALCALALLTACQDTGTSSDSETAEASAAEETSAMAQHLAKYTDFTLTTDVSTLTDAQKQMIPLLIDAAKAMDQGFWMQAYPGDREELLGGLDADTRRFAEINYGPWDRLDGNAPFVEGVGPKPAGANFYPADMSKEDLEAAAEENAALSSLYTIVRRDDAGALTAHPYSEVYAEQYALAAEKLRAAAELAEEAGLKKYLTMRADALLSDEYYESDIAWMDMSDNVLDVVIGPIETYEDQLFGYKASNSAYILVKDTAWSERLARYADFLPELQRGLPVADAYKTETPGSESQLNAYDVVYYAGDCNAGSKTIAINLPNDEDVQLKKGTRRLQLKNAMRAKFDKILVPISQELIAEDQRGHITFDAFFANTMFHEVAHGLGIKNTITGNGTVRSALQNHASALEEGKADVLGLYMVTSLAAKGEMEGELHDNYATFMASIFRSIRFGSSSAHGVANLIRFNYFAEMGAFQRDENGLYSVDFAQLSEAVNSLSEKILTWQGDGDYAAVAAFVEKYGKEGAELRADLDRLSAAGIPVDVTFTQGVEVLGL